MRSEADDDAELEGVKGDGEGEGDASKEKELKGESVEDGVAGAGLERLIGSRELVYNCRICCKFV